MPNSLSKYRILDDELVEHIAGLPRREQSDWLFLEPHPEYAGRWYVDALTQGFYLDFEEVIGKYRTVSPASLERFLAHADERDYEVAFVEDPASILDAWAHLNDPPAFKLDSNMGPWLREQGLDREAEVVEATGFLPFQLQGFNYLRNPDLKGGLAVWSTGTGKTALVAALIRQHLYVEDYDTTLVVVKSNNKYDMLRKLKELGGIDSLVLDGTPKQREEIYDLCRQAQALGEKLTLITNYEKFREDEEDFRNLFTDRNVVIFWDEMPTKLSNRATILYDCVREAIYDGSKQIKWANRRPNKLRQYDLSAMPIENSPVGLLNQVRLIDPEVFPVIREWESQFVATRNFFSKEPETFKNLEKMGLMLDFMTHQVDKDDPDIAKLFPKVREIVRYVDWNPSDRKVYDKLQDIAGALAMKAKADPTVKKLNAFQLIGVLQMLCDAPSMVQKSAENREEFEAILAAATTDAEVAEAENFLSGSEAALMLLRTLKKPLTDEKHTKIQVLKEIITEKHRGKKIVVFSKLADYIQPVLTKFFDDWGVTYVVYRGTDKQRLEAKDQFRNDPNIQIFLSSDAGSDSIDLPEASVAVDFDEPLVWARKMQRRNRIHRVNSTHGYVTFYTLRMANSVEDRIAEIIETKAGYHSSVFKGEINENAISARMTQQDLMYILTGEREADTL
jgi:SNF2 family DNA or RNA helicase